MKKDEEPANPVQEKTEDPYSDSEEIESIWDKVNRRAEYDADKRMEDRIMRIHIYH